MTDATLIEMLAKLEARMNQLEKVREDKVAFAEAFARMEALMMEIRVSQLKEANKKERAEFLTSWKGKIPIHFNRVSTSPGMNLKRSCSGSLAKSNKKIQPWAGSNNRSGGNKKAQAMRKFDNLGITLSEAFADLSMKGYLEALVPRPLPNPLPPLWKQNEYCAFHQRIGHETNNCMRLKHEIQDLIDSGTLPKPEIPSK